jgi:hypothetical protein
MSAEVFAFPMPAPATARVAEGAPSNHAPFRVRRTYSLGDMVKLCGLDDYETRTAIEHLRLYASKSGLPLPRNVRRYAGQVIDGPLSIGARSKWDAMLVDAWLDRGPPPVGGALALPEVGEIPPLPVHRRADMAQRARQLAAR